MGKRVLKEYIQNIHNKISVVVAIAVLKHKPEYLTAEQYAEKVQELVFDSWVKNNNASVFENKIIELHLDKLFNQINSILGSPLQADSQILSTLNETIPGVCTEQYLDHELFFESDSDSSDNDICKNHLSFIRAMIQLKFTVDSSKVIPKDVLHDFLNKISKKNKFGNNTRKMITYSEDSGFGEHSAQTTCNLVSSSTFRFITHSSKTNHLIKKCMTSVIRYAYKSVLTNTIETFACWKGSIIEYLCTVLQEISSHPVCSDYLLKFIIKILDEIWSSQGINKHLIWEYQQHMVSEFCVNIHVCESVTDLLMDKFNILADMINTLQIGSPEHLNSIHLFEKFPHFAQLVATVIKKFHTYKAADDNQTQKVLEYSTYHSVADLWKVKWRENNETETEVAKKIYEVKLKKWKEVCEKLITASTDNFPMIPFYVSGIMAMLGVG